MMKSVLNSLLLFVAWLATTLPLTAMAMALFVMPHPVVAQQPLHLRGPPSKPPRDLLIFYAWPSTINSCFGNVDCASGEFGMYDFVVFGDTLQDPSHPDYSNFVGILAHPDLEETAKFGYVDLGVTTQNLTMEQIASRMDAWKTLDIDGVLLDDFGYDWEVSRQRQNDAVEYAHSIGLSVIANAFRPEDAFGNDHDATYNPDELETSLGEEDFYLYESYQITLDSYVSDDVWRSKAELIKQFQKQHRFQVLSITTTATGAYGQDQFHYTWFSALIDGHDATGWGELYFSAGDSIAPYRTRPDLDSISSDMPASSDTLYLRKTNKGVKGVAYVDSTSHAYGFVPKE